MNNFIKAGLALVVIGGLSWGGMTINHRIECQGMEDDILNSFASMKRNGMLRVLGKPNITKLADEEDQIEERKIENLTKEMQQKCGTRAVETTLRKHIESL